MQGSGGLSEQNSCEGNVLLNNSKGCWWAAVRHLCLCVGGWVVRVSGEKAAVGLLSPPDLLLVISDATCRSKSKCSKISLLPLLWDISALI